MSECLPWECLAIVGRGLWEGRNDRKNMISKLVTGDHVVCCLLQQLLFIITIPAQNVETLKGLLCDLLVNTFILFIYWLIHLFNVESISKMIRVCDLFWYTRFK